MMSRLQHAAVCRLVGWMHIAQNHAASHSLPVCTCSHVRCMQVADNPDAFSNLLAELRLPIIPAVREAVKTAWKKYLASIDGVAHRAQHDARDDVQADEDAGDAGMYRLILHSLYQVICSSAGRGLLYRVRIQLVCSGSACCMISHVAAVCKVITCAHAQLQQGNAWCCRCACYNRRCCVEPERKLANVRCTR